MECDLDAHSLGVILWVERGIFMFLLHVLRVMEQNSRSLYGRHGGLDACPSWYVDSRSVKVTFFQVFLPWDCELGHSDRLSGGTS